MDPSKGKSNPRAAGCFGQLSALLNEGDLLDKGTRSIPCGYNVPVIGSRLSSANAFASLLMRLRFPMCCVTALRRPVLCGVTDCVPQGSPVHVC